MENAIKQARELGRAIQNEDFYKELYAAKDKADADEALQALIALFNQKRVAINNEACKSDRDEEVLHTLNEEMRTVYSQIMSNENMIAYNNAKQNFDTALNRINAIIEQCAEGGDPDTADFDPSCTHDCSTCCRCH